MKMIVILLSLCFVMLSTFEATGQIPYRENWYENPDLYLKMIVENHPAKEISQDLDSLIVNYIVFINFQEGMALGGSGLATLTIVNMQGYGLRPVLNISLTALLNPANSLCFKQMVIRHEYQHILQLLSGRLPKEHFMFRNTEVPFTEKEIRQHFEAEAEAYLEESKFALSQGCAEEYDICLAYKNGGEKALRLKLAEELSKTQVYAPYKDLLFKIAKERS